MRSREGREVADTGLLHLNQNDEYWVCQKALKAPWNQTERFKYQALISPNLQCIGHRGKRNKKITFQLLKSLMDSILGRLQLCIDAGGEITEWRSPISKQFLGIHLLFVVLRLLFEERLRTLGVSFVEPSYIVIAPFYARIALWKFRVDKQWQWLTENWPELKYIIFSN